MGGPRRTPKESVDALEEALMILRAFWSGERIASDLRFSTLSVNVPTEDPIGFVRRLGEDVAPRVRELV